MALRDQPYLPLYIQDFMTDEKLIECSASATGVFIRLMCIMHKSEPYGTILLKQKDKQTVKQINNFACKLAKSMPFSEQVIFDGLTELVAEGVLQINGDFLEQKRMINDCLLSEKRSLAGKQGGVKTQGKNKKFASTFAKAKSKANTENEIEYDNEVDIDFKKVKSKNFFPPSLSDAAIQFSLNSPSHWTADHMGKEIEAWFDYYNSNGWKVGKNKMKDWKAAIRTWIRNDYNFSKNGNSGTGKPTDKNGHTIIAGRVTQQAADELLAAAQLYEQRKKDANGNFGPQGNGNDRD